MKSYPLITVLFSLSVFFSQAQINYSANDFGSVPAYNGTFRYGSNMGYYGPSWNDRTLADIAAGNVSLNVKGAGVKSLRLFLPESFLEYWGYDVRLAEFNHYSNLSVLDNVVALEDPSPAHKDNTIFAGCATESRVWKNMYDNIWDGGANGTPVNDNNYFALYVYKTVTRYKTVTKFWEIINEPDLDIVGHGPQEPGMFGNWWENNPNPCDLPNLKAPIFYYVRLLRIAYEVIKTVDPTAYVAPGGLGFPSFLDAILRNTDNPADGSVNATYPLKGGAYFDVMSFHMYPAYSLKNWDNGIGSMVYHRHSDAAVDSFTNTKARMAQVLIDRGYDNTTYPSKHFICTETNIARLPFLYGAVPLIGGDIVQKNYLMKALIQSQKNGISQFYTFILGDAKNEIDATQEYDVMGLYKKLEGNGPLTNGGAYNQQFSNSGIGFKTTSDLLRNKSFDAARTIEMNLPAGIEGAAFRDGSGDFTYVLWARTANDQSENSSATYSFPVAMNVAPEFTKREWDFSYTGIGTPISSSNIALDASPIFLLENIQLVDLDEEGGGVNQSKNDFQVTVFPIPATSTANVSFTLKSPERVSISLYDANGKMLKPLVSAKNYSTGKHSVPIEYINILNSGLYYLRFNTEKISLTKKLIISR